MKVLLRRRLIQTTLREGIGPSVALRIIRIAHEQGIDPATISVHELAALCGLPVATCQTAQTIWADERLLPVLERQLESENIALVTILDEEYPAALAAIEQPPIVLYVQGVVAALGLTGLAVVGSRQASSYGYQAIDALVPSMASAGVSIVSGGAIGVDTHAHKVALQSGITTIAVIGSGLLQPYPASNKKLFAAIVAAGGAVVSPFGLNMMPLPQNFPARNRIIAGLSAGCLVVQAAAKSGALITATMAMQQGRTVMAVPGIFNDPLSAGCHKLICDGATLVTSVQDIMAAVPFFSTKPKERNHPQGHQGLQLSISEPTLEDEDDYEEQDEILSLLANARRPLGLEEICAKTNLSWVVATERLFGLQLDQRVNQDFAGLWSLHTR